MQNRRFFIKLLQQATLMAKERAKCQEHQRRPNAMMKGVRRQRHTGCTTAWATDDDNNDAECDGHGDDDHVEDNDALRSFSEARRQGVPRFGVLWSPWHDDDARSTESWGVGLGVGCWVKWMGWVLGGSVLSGGVLGWVVSVVVSEVFDFVEEEIEKKTQKPQK